jgi:hypothetical protein
MYFKFNSAISWSLSLKETAGNQEFHAKIKNSISQMYPVY